MYWSCAASFPKAASSTPPPYSFRLARARSRSCSMPQPDFATPMTGTAKSPRLIMPWSDGKIFLYARSPVAPKNTSASAATGLPPVSADAIVVLLAVPKREASEQALLVGHDHDVGGQVGLDLLRVAASDVEAVEVEERRERRDGLQNPLVPFPLAGLLQGFDAELLLVSLVAPARVVRELEVGHEQPIHEERGAESRAERDDELDTFALDRSEAL